MKESNHQQVLEDDIVTITDKELVDELKRLSNIDKKQLNRPGTKEITELKWNGSLLKLAGYAFINETTVTHEDQVSKSVILKNAHDTDCYFEFPVIELEGNSKMSKEDLVKHKWAGFEVEINFSQITQKAEPLPDGTYQVYIQVNTIDQDSTYKETVLSLGNISGLLNNGFHSTKMEYFSAKKLLVYNLMASYNRKEKTLEIVSTKLKDINPAELEYQNVKTKQYKFMRKYVFKLLYMIFCLFPIKGNRVLFATDSRTELNGNFGFIHDEMISRNLNIDYRYMLKESIDEKKTFKDIWNLAFWCATSKKIILDDFYPMIYPLRIRKEADLIQVWHAVGAFKTFGYSRVGRPGGPSIRSINHRNYTKAVVSSKNVGRHYAEGFGIDENETIVPIGAPRTDVFFDDVYKNAKKEELYDEYPFLKGKKVILFAPTFRGNGQSSAHYPFDVLNFKELYENLKDEYVLSSKFIPLLITK